MSNRVIVEAYAEKNGYVDVKIADDYGKTVFSFDSPLPENDIEILKKLRRLAQIEDNEIALDILVNVVDNKKGITIRDTFYDYDKLLEVFEKETELVVNIPYNVQLHDRWTAKLNETVGKEFVQVVNMGQTDDVVYNVPANIVATLIEKVGELDFVLGVFDQHTEEE